MRLVRKNKLHCNIISFTIFIFSYQTFLCIEFSLWKCKWSCPVPPSLCAAQVNSWPYSTPTPLSERAALISAATSSCSPQTSRWVTSASWTSLTWGIHSRLVHRYYTIHTDINFSCFFHFFARKETSQPHPAFSSVCLGLIRCDHINLQWINLISVLNLSYHVL